MGENHFPRRLAMKGRKDIDLGDNLKHSGLAMVFLRMGGISMFVGSSRGTRKHKGR